MLNNKENNYNTTSKDSTTTNNNILNNNNVDDSVIPTFTTFSYIGSSNFGHRSWQRDFELGFLLFTNNPTIKSKLQQECHKMMSHCHNNSYTSIKYYKKSHSHNKKNLFSLSYRYFIKFVTNSLRSYL